MRGMDFSQKHDTVRYVKILELLIPIFICHVYGIQIDLIPVQSICLYVEVLLNFCKFELMSCCKNERLFWETYCFSYNTKRNTKLKALGFR